jgi:hypothetical protein
MVEILKDGQGSDRKTDTSRELALGGCGIRCHREDPKNHRQS